MRDLMIVSERAAAGRASVVSPYDGRELERVATSNAAHVEDALVRSPIRCFGIAVKPGCQFPERIAILTQKTASKSCQSQAEDLTRACSERRWQAIQRTPGLRSSVRSMACVYASKALRGRRRLRYSIGHNAKRRWVASAFTHKEPIGVVVAVSAFNHPLNLIVHQVGPAVASGCPVIVKPASDTPLSCLRFVEILREAGLPDGWAQAIITEDSATAETLVTDKRVAFFSFIGSSKVGWMLRSKLAPGARCALEHGGVAPVILADPYDEVKALASIAKGGFYHAGQVCVSVQRVFAPAKRQRSLRSSSQC